MIEPSVPTASGTRAAIAGPGGLVIETTGDGMLAAFDRATAAGRALTIRDAVALAVEE
jgi:class 3 adenylate cyclase